VDPSAAQPHDALVKALIGPPEHAAGLFRAVLPAAFARRIDFARLERLPGSFVAPDLRQHHTDLLYSAPFADGREALLHLVVEHQSAPDPIMAWRTHRYVVRVLERWHEKHADAQKLPAVLPVVLYHGPQRWRAPTAFPDLLDLTPEERAEIGDHVAGPRFLLVDLSRYSDERLWAEVFGRTADATAQLALLALQHVATSPDLAELVRRRLAPLLRELLAAPTGLHALEVFLRYTLAVSRSVDWPAFERVLAAEVGPKAEAVVVPYVHELVEQSYAKGRDDGRDEGRAEGQAVGQATGRAEMLLKQIRLRFGPLTPADEARVRQATPEEHDLWAERVLTAATLADLFA
jgi:predicted transposase YdaD